MKAKLLQFFNKYKIPKQYHSEIEAALKGRGQTRSLGGLEEAENAIDDIAERAGIPMFRTDEVTGKVVSTPIADDLLELMRLFSGG